jgi:hypothetical protein
MQTGRLYRHQCLPALADKFEIPAPEGVLIILFICYTQGSLGDVVEKSIAY